MEKYTVRRDRTPRRRHDENRPTRRPYAAKDSGEEKRPYRRRSESDGEPAHRTSSKSWQRPSSRPYAGRGDDRFHSRGEGRRPYGKREEGHRDGGRRPHPRAFNDSAARTVSAPESVPVQGDGLVRLNKIISNSGICSRREADTFISTGLVTVNGIKVTELGVKVNPQVDDVRFNGERIKGERKVYLIMNKPKDYVTTVSDPHAEKTVMDLISKTKCPERVVPVGRLDKATTGVLLFTNDGPMIEKLTHPSYGIKKIYHIFLDRNLSKDDFDSIVNGIELEDGPIAADAISYVEGDRSQVGLEIHSGRNRIVRRIFEHLGYKVKKLDRVYFAGLTKKNIRRGEWRFLDEKEINLLRMGAVK